MSPGLLAPAAPAPVAQLSVLASVQAPQASPAPPLLRDGWTRHFDHTTNRYYYHHAARNITEWESPPPPLAPPPSPPYPKPAPPALPVVAQCASWTECAVSSSGAPVPSDSWAAPPSAALVFDDISTPMGSPRDGSWPQHASGSGIAAALAKAPPPALAWQAQRAHGREGPIWEC